jgi:hypothetical protein
VKFTEGVKLYGKDWIQVSMVIGTRSEEQCRARHTTLTRLKKMPTFESGMQEVYKIFKGQNDKCDKFGVVSKIKTDPN